MKPIPKVGQRLFSLNVGNAARRVPQVLTPVIVTKVGRKYFTVKRDEQYAFGTEFWIEDWRQKTEYSNDHALYETEQEWLDEKETFSLLDDIRKAFDYGMGRTIPLENLRKIAELAGIKESAQSAK